MADEEKDPAFLFYSLDWLQGTASLFPEEKGVYIDLLCHQHRDGSIPNDVERLARMVGLSVDRFSTIWSTVRLKFVDRPVNRLVNLRLEREMTKRSTTSHKNAIIGRLAVLVRKAKHVPEEIIDDIKKDFKVTDYESLDLPEATTRLTEWWTERLTERSNNGPPNGKPFPIENENENKDRIEEEERGLGKEEEERKGSKDPPEGDWSHLPRHASSLCLSMVEKYISAFPAYPRDDEKDFAACLQIAYGLVQIRGWPWQSALNGKMREMLDDWGAIVEWLPESDWYRSKPLSFLAKDFQGLIQAKNDGLIKKRQGNRGSPGNGATNGIDPTRIEREGVGKL